MTQQASEVPRECDPLKKKSTINSLEAGEILIPRDVFNTWLRDSDFLDVIEECEIETATKFELFDVLDVDMGGELSFDELVNGLMRLRGPISKSDTVAVRLKVRYMTHMLEELHH